MNQKSLSLIGLLFIFQLISESFAGIHRKKSSTRNKQIAFSAGNLVSKLHEARVLPELVRLSDLKQNHLRTPGQRAHATLQLKRERRAHRRFPRILRAIEKENIVEKNLLKIRNARKQLLDSRRLKIKDSAVDSVMEFPEAASTLKDGASLKAASETQPPEEHSEAPKQSKREVKPLRLLVPIYVPGREFYEVEDPESASA